MKSVFKYILLCIALISGNLKAEPIIADLGLHEIHIDSDFSGIDVLLYGYRNDPGRILVALRGPSRDYAVRKKERTAGIWANKDSAEFYDVPSLFALWSSSKLEDIRNDELLNALELKLDKINLVSDFEYKELNEFRTAFTKNQVESGLYNTEIGEVNLGFDPLFRSQINFPDNLERGIYAVEIYLFDSGTVSSMQIIPVEVKKSGFDAFMYDLAHQQKYIYGLVCILMAVIFGWLANRFMRR